MINAIDIAMLVLPTKTKANNENAHKPNDHIFCAAREYASAHPVAGVNSPCVHLSFIAYDVLNKRRAVACPNEHSEWLDFLVSCFYKLWSGVQL